MDITDKGCGECAESAHEGMRQSRTSVTCGVTFAVSGPTTNYAIMTVNIRWKLALLLAYTFADAHLAVMFVSMFLQQNLVS